MTTSSHRPHEVEDGRQIMGTMVSKDGKPKEKRGDKGDDAKPSRVEWKGYLSPTLTTNEKALYREWRTNSGACEEALKSALDAGFKISVDFQPRERAYRAGLYCQAVDRKEAGYCLTVFAGDWWEAVNRVVFIHHALLSADWTALINGSSWKDDWLD